MMADHSVFILLDVRTDAEYRERHIDGAILRRVGTISAQTAGSIYMITNYSVEGRPSEAKSRQAQKEEAKLHMQFALANLLLADMPCLQGYLEPVFKKVR